MSRLTMPSTALVALILVSCGGSGGRNYWLYPAPRLPEAEEAVFIAYEAHQVQAIDGEETQSRCWGLARQPQGYARQDVACRLHLQPGEHSVTFSSGARSRERRTVTFTAVAGREYGLDRSACSGSNEAASRTCRVEVIEVGTVPGGGAAPGGV